jgi:hypothetical protein
MKVGIYIARVQVLAMLDPKLAIPEAENDQSWAVAVVALSSFVTIHSSFDEARIYALAEGKRIKIKVLHIRSTRLL